MKKSMFLFCLVLLMIFAAGSASADSWHTSNTLLGHAVPDECYAGLGGVDYPGGITPGDGYTTPVSCPDTTPNPFFGAEGEPENLPVYEKTNDAYVWALTDEGNSLWFASAANVMCTTAGVFLGELSYGENRIALHRNWPVYDNHSMNADGNPMYEAFNGTDYPPAAICDGPCGEQVDDQTIRVPYNVCEHGDSMTARNGMVSDATGDWRPSKVFRYIKEGSQAGTLVNLTDQIYAAGDGDVFDDLLGIRAAGSNRGVIFFAGGNQSYTGVSMFAFRSNGTYLGYNTFSNYRQIRKMIVVNNQLYTGVAGAGGGGAILRWAGNRWNLWRWVTVGNVGGSVTELTEYVDGNGQTRIVANAAAGLYVSPPMTWWGRLFPWNAGSWTNVWSASVYEPDTYSALSYGPGAVAQLGEWVYWGTMHIPYHAFYLNAQFRFGGIENVPEEQEYAMYYGTLRATTVWRGRNLGQAGQEIQLLYGETHLGAWDNTAGTFVGRETGWTPLNMPPPEYPPHPYFGTPMGSSGFFNPYNNYSWVALAYSDGTGDHVFWGTMDQGLINDTDIDDLAPSFDVPDGYVKGADLWRFSLNGFGGATDVTAAAEFTNGAGNPYQYGVRCLIKSDSEDEVFIGMANNGNLMNQDVTDAYGFTPGLNGGWELRQLAR